MICFFRHVFIKAIYATISETSKNAIERMNIFRDFEKATTKTSHQYYKSNKIPKNYSTLHMLHVICMF